MIESFSIEYNSKGDLASLQHRLEKYSPSNVLIQVFSGRPVYKHNVEILEDLTSTFPGVSIAGTTTAGEIMAGSVSEGKVIINFMLFKDSTVKTILIDQNHNLTRAGGDIGRAFAPLNPKAVIAFGCGIKDKRTIDGSALIGELQSSLSDTVIAGGQAGDNGAGLTSFVFTETGISDHGVAAAALSGETLIVNNQYNLAWIPIGKSLTITRAKGPRVYSIDNETPYELYKRYLGQAVADGLPLSAVDFPLMIERDGITMAIHAMGVNDDGSFDYIHSFHTGEQLKFGFCHAGLLALSAQETYEHLRKQPVDAVFMYSCVSRKWILGEDIDVEVCPISQLAPLAGFFAYGEYFSHSTGKGFFFSQTMTVLALGEKDRNRILDNEAEASCPDNNDSRQLKTLKALHRLVETSAREIEEINSELLQLSQKDSLTGLYNRRYLDAQFSIEIKRASRTKKPLSVILIDVDYFKRYNDTYGHVAGDNCLRGIALEVKKVFKRPVDLFARYGGEEFICILPETDVDGARHIAEKIQETIKNLSFEHAQSAVSDFVTVSMGMVTARRVDKTMTQDFFIKACDKRLYEAKAAGRNRIIFDEL